MRLGKNQSILKQRDARVRGGHRDRAFALQAGSVLVIVLWVALGSGYEIDERDIHLRLGPMRWRLPLDSIEDVYSTCRFHHDFGWGLALSFDRLRIKCRDRWLPFWISPEDKAAFIAELRRANPYMKVTQD